MSYELPKRAEIEEEYMDIVERFEHEFKVKADTIRFEHASDKDSNKQATKAFTFERIWTQDKSNQ